MTGHRAPRSGLRHLLVSVLVTLLALSGLGGVALAAPPAAAPAPVGPADGASVTIPFAISWTAPGDPAAVGGYHWQVSRTPDFATVLERNPVQLSDTTTSDVVSGLPDGGYFWRVQAVSRAQEPGPWSAPRSVVVTGAGAGVPGTPVLAPPRGGPQFHVNENITFSWTAVPGAVDYVLQESTDPAFPVGTRVRQVNLLGTTAQVAFNTASQGTFQARVLAVNAEGLMGTPSNLVEFSVLDSNPLPPPPTLVGPLGGVAQPLAVTLTWNHVANPQDRGYQVEVAPTSSFSSVERVFPEITGTTLVVPTLTPGTKFWRVRAQQGYIGIDPAFTAWSATGSFTVPASGARMSALTFPSQAYSGGEARGSADLTAPAPAGGALVTLSTSHPELLPELPEPRTIPAGESSIRLLVAPTGAINSLRGMRVGFVTAPTTVTVTATYNGTSASTPITLLPPRLNDTPGQIYPVKATGGADMVGIVDLEVGCSAGFCDGLAPPGGFPVSLSTSSPAATVPATITIPAAAGGTDFPIRTSPVATTTTIAITARAGDAIASWRITLTPEPPPDTFRLDPVETAGGSRGIVTIPLSAALGYDQRLRVASSNPAVAAVPQFVTVPSSMNSGVFPITTGMVGTRTVVTITVTGGGVSRTAELAVSPNLPVLTALTVSPTSVTGGTPATGTVTLGSAAPSGGVAVSLDSRLPGAATVPSAVTVPAGATSVTFPVTTSAVDTTTVQLSATLGSATQFASLGITRASGLSALTLSPTTVVGGASSTGMVTLSSAAPSGGTVVTLSDNSGAATVPASITVAAGSTSRTFTVPTSTVTAQTAVVVTGSSGGVTRSATLTVNPPTPAAPALRSPADQATGLPQPVTLDWNDVPNAVSYEIRVDDSSTMSSPYVANPTSTVSQTTLSGLPGRQLWWQVRARNAAGVLGPLSSTRSFTPQVATTTAPSLSSVSLAPTSVVGGSSATGTVTLTAAAPAGGLAVALADDSAAVTVPAGVTVAAGQTSATFTATTSTVTAQTTATITVTAGGASRTAGLTVTAVASGPPAAPSLLSPAQDARFSAGQAIAFDWSDVAGAAGYTIQIDDQDTFASPTANQAVTASTYTSNALPVARMWWRVRAVDASGNPGAWAAVRRFEVR
jgi:hypothetical protein